MHIIYHCVGGTHSSAIAAAVHLNLLPDNKKPSPKEILSIPFFDTLVKEDQGKILYRGSDNQSNKIYTLSRQFSPQLVLPAIKDAWELAGGKRENLLLVNSMPAVNLLMKIGGFSSRRLGLVSFGRPIVTRGTIKAYDAIVKIVNNTKTRINN
ncbi:DUF3189 family protein [Sporosalibacterium faouarense]|uniref:DUF3189 family protein n=1 Tax=Sporosalibacterium faouarense TaxID=516123 RepID=UPI00141C22B2|nr:DUF3189 family protein [Sporosalibacterium faouarense]MTI49106.1 DUF3189 family protein [Bacillota bacterium]